ncbi:HNH endonuclease signature motif containing protein [Pseudarthrobacter sp. PS3-L1]|uniref:HNH endonuclease n=1 Tax=Pseudarthrobacter sp. PS3-L1 TaxID=3046207 RepID=UPI0024BB98F5|nr:HNH endonuclease signature motif containing protein [Pseudarthrobacter sp. PS3-L1]MDJ0319075.1 DUF222 domain-containing protein [Pseudarthrobacter sp. PS3-L1]
MESTQDFLPLITPVSPAISARSGGLHGTAGFGVAGLGQLVAAILPSATGPGLIDQIRALEDLKSAAAAAQARLTVSFDALERHHQALAGVPAAERGRGVAAQVALARRESPARGSRLLGLANALVSEMPHTLAALRAGQLNEWRATLLVRETACLSAADRSAVDAELAPEASTFNGLGDRAVIAAARTAAYRRDGRSVALRASHAATERRVSLRPAPDTMTYLTALLPVAEGMAVYATLTRQADTARASGEVRTRGQIMADSLVERVTGTPGGITGVQISLVMTDRTLLRGHCEPARLAGYGVVPAQWARSLVNSAPADNADGTSGNADATHSAVGNADATHSAVGNADATHSTRSRPGENLRIWVRRLYTAPGTGELISMDSRARLFPSRMRRFIEARDATCRTPYCDAPIRHFDHVIPWHLGGPTVPDNGAGLCEACNHTKELPYWKTKPTPGPRHRTRLTTPTGHTYHSTAPPLPGRV